MFKSIKKFVWLSILIYFVLFSFLVSFAGSGGSDIVGGTYTYFGFVILSSAILHISKK